MADLVSTPSPLAAGVFTTVAGLLLTWVLVAWYQAHVACDARHGVLVVGEFRPVCVTLR